MEFASHFGFHLPVFAFIGGPNAGAIQLKAARLQTLGPGRWICQMHDVRCWGAVITFAGMLVTGAAQEPTPESIFETRLKPIFDSPNPSSCVQCHLSAVDLKDYILPSSRETFLSLREQGLIDTERPGESKILHLISMGDSDPDALARRIHAKNRKAEYDAFSYWIVACCQDQDLLSARPSVGNQKAGPSHSDDLIRHTRKDRVLDSFVRNVWSQRMRCFPCHTPGELDADNPMHQKPIERHRDFVKQYGARMNLFKETPWETMRSLVASSRIVGSEQKRKGTGLPLINLKNPTLSLLIQKPTAKLPPKTLEGKMGEPSSQNPVSHMGGIKMHKGDQSYKAWLHWLEDYAASVSGGYESDDELPEDNWYPTQHVVRIKGVPESWPNLATVQVFVHRWDEETDRWADEPIAFTQSLVTPRKMVNGSLFVLAKPEQRDQLDPAGVTLEPCKVQMRLFLDHDNTLAESPTRLLNNRDPDATSVFDAVFGIGFKNADVIETLEIP
ncbi:hypothetical protein Pan14r_09260 [Crateriforma conspicua]|uniref:Cytochrome c domain-containing protein n=2 Tax=Crateriforma conspicua TaxID=2527996 RepID=A0A5C5Y1H8_9PLAN|nr:hypothetical protein Pan14r_09260 [Crateriforma conspicua]